MEIQIHLETDSAWFRLNAEGKRVIAETSVRETDADSLVKLE